jgi:hypothetical protein
MVTQRRADLSVGRVLGPRRRFTLDRRRRPVGLARPHWAPGLSSGANARAKRGCGRRRPDSARVRTNATSRTPRQSGVWRRFLSGRRRQGRALRKPGQAGCSVRGGCGYATGGPSAPPLSLTSRRPVSAISCTTTSVRTFLSISPRHSGLRSVSTRRAAHLTGWRTVPSEESPRHPSLFTLEEIEHAATRAGQLVCGSDERLTTS